MDRIEAFKLASQNWSGVGTRSMSQVLIDAEMLMNWVNENAESDLDRARRIWKEESLNPTTPNSGPSRLQAIKKLREELQNAGRPEAGLKYYKGWIDYVSGRSPICPIMPS